MILGKQSTLNDLQMMQTDLEAKIEVAKQIKANAVAGSEVVPFPVPTDSGKNYSDFAAPALTVTQLRDGSDLFPGGATGAVKTVVIKSEADFAAILCIEDALTPRAWIRGVSIGTVGNAVELLTSANTIVDANGFLKTA